MSHAAEAIDKAVRSAGCIALVNLPGTRVDFYPRGHLPPCLMTLLTEDKNRRLLILREFLIAQARFGTV